MAKFPSIVRKYGTSVSLELRFPVNAPSLELVNAEIEKMRHAVIPICGQDVHKRPCLLGSGVLVNFGGGPVLVTAAHVLSDNENVPFFFFGACGRARSLGGTFIVSEADDLAAKLLSPEECVDLSHIQPLAESIVAPTGFAGGSFYASVVGYPASASKRPERGALDTPLEVYSNFATELIGGNISVYFDWKSGSFHDTYGHVRARKPTGKSGGAIFGFPAQLNTVWPMIGPKLIGIATRWKRTENRIEGAGPSSLFRMLKAVTAGVP